jgi:hypothetical protein
VVYLKISTTRYSGPMMKAGSKNRSRMRILKRLTTIPNVLSEGAHMRFSALSLMRSGEGFNQVRTEDHDVVVRYVVGPEPITVRLRRV